MKTFKHQLLAEAAASGLSGVCGLVWQGDFGKGVPTGSGVWSDAGANPCILYGPQGTNNGTSGLGIPAQQWRLGMVVNGDYGSEFVYAKLVLAATTDILPGQGYFLDKDFNATLISGTNANNTLNAEVGTLNVWAPNAAAGTYFVWLQRAGHASVQAATGSVASGLAETVSGVNGQFKFPAAATVGQKSVGPMTGFVASSGVTFTGNTVNGSPYITGLSSITDLQLGQVITGTNLPANAIIAAIDKLGGGGGYRITIGTNTAGSYATTQAATGTATGTTFTVTSHVTANIYWPTLNKQN